MLINLKRNMLLVGIALTCAFAAFVTVGLPVQAQTAPADEACAALQLLDNTITCGGATDTASKNKIVSAITAAINIMSFIVGIIAVIMIIIAGIRFMTSGGDPQTASGARQTIIYAIVGIVIVVFAQSIVAFVLNKIK